MMMVNLEMGSFVLNQQSSHGIMDEGKKRQGCGAAAAAALSSSSSEVSSVVSSDDSDLFDEVNSPTSQTSDSSASSSGQLVPLISEPLQDMSSLLQELPFKRGLSKHYNGKSQSFTSLANVRSLEDLAKPENPYNKKLKSCKSYGGLMESHGSSPQPAPRGNSSRLMSKKASRGSCSSLCVKRNSSFIANRPPIPPPHRSTSTSSFAPQTSLFALGV